MQLAGQPLRIGVVFGQTLAHDRQGQEARCRQYAGLAHAAAHQLAQPPGPGDKSGRSGQDRSDRGGQPLGQAAHHGIDVTGDLAHVAIQCRGSIENAGAVQMHRHLPAAGNGGGVGHDVERDDTAVGMGVFQADQPGARPVDVFALADAGLDLAGRQHAAVTGDGAQLHAGQHGSAAGFVPDDMAVVAQDDFIAALAMRHQRQLVAEVAGRHEQGGFLAEDAGGQGFQLLHGRIVTVDIIADLGMEHRLAHGRGRLGNGIAADVDPAGHDRAPVQAKNACQYARAPWLRTPSALSGQQLPQDERQDAAVAVVIRFDRCVDA